MSDFYLKTPDITMLDDIAAFRQEFLDNGDRINGSSNLQDYPNPKKWLDYLEFEKRRSTDFKDFPESFQCVYVNGDTGLIVGMIQYRNDYVKKINKYWEISDIVYVHVNVEKDMQKKCFPICLSSVPKRE